MASFDPIDFDPSAPPPRPTTPPVRWGFVAVLLGLSLAALVVYGVPFVAWRVGYAYESGRARAAIEALEKLEKDDSGVIKRSSALFRLATTAVAPAVVNISNYRAIPAGPARPGAPARVGGLARVGSGSGVVIDQARGFVVTNNHVINGADRIGVRLGRGDEATATLIGTDPKTDLAVLRVGLPFPAEARWGDSDKLDIGDWVLAIGSPFELDRTVTAGIVSATGRDNLRVLGEGSYQDFIQTDAPINPGNSGGPLVDLGGRVVGINTAIYSSPREGGEEMGGNVGIGFAISSALARRIVEDLIKNGRVVRGYLGVAIDDLGGERARQLKLPAGEGALIIEVQPDSPAAQAGLKPGDVIVALGGKPVADRSALRNRAATLPAGAKVPLRYLRDGKPSTVEVTVGESPALLDLGLRLRALPPEQAQALPGSPASALVIDQVMPGSPAQRAHLIPGLRVVAVGDVPVKTQADCNAAVAALDPAKGVPLHIQAPDGRTEATVVVGGRGPDGGR